MYSTTLVFDRADMGQLFDLDRLWSGLAAPTSQSQDGVFSWVGDFYPYGSFPGKLEGVVVPEVPQVLGGDGFRAGLIEWTAFALALKLRLAEGDGSANLIECGASQGLWALPWIRLMQQHCQSGSFDARAIAIEASPSRDAAVEFWQSQDLNFQTTLKDRDFTAIGERWKFEWLQRAVVAKAGKVRFPRVDVRRDNGAQAVSKKGNLSGIDTRGRKVNYDVVEGIQLRSLIRELKHVDFLHLDLQGAEFEILRSDGFACLAGTTEVVLLGCHSRLIEGEAMERLPEYGFTLLAEDQCAFAIGIDPQAGKGRSPRLQRDGEQLWLSERSLQRARELGLILI